MEDYPTTNDRVRSQFSMLGQTGRTFPFTYLDSAATSLCPDCVLETMDSFERTTRANIHRGIYRQAEAASDAFEQGRCAIAQFFGADPISTILTSGTTAALNLTAVSWAEHTLHEGDLIALDTANHHANIVPWQMLASRTGVELAFIGVDKSGRLDTERWHELLDRGAKAAALCHVSNVTGEARDIRTLVAEAHAAGCAVICDFAQSAGHTAIDLTTLGVDFAGVSAHKMYGPFGIGALFVSPERMSQMVPSAGGGGMIERVSEKGFIPLAGPPGFEPGTPDITGVIGFARACRFVEELGLDKLENTSRHLVTSIFRFLTALPGVDVAGTPDPTDRLSLISFTIEGLHPHDLSTSLAEKNIAVRAGHHCAMPLHTALGLNATTRVSLGCYSTEEDIERLYSAIVGTMEEYAL